MIRMIHMMTMITANCNHKNQTNHSSRQSLIIPHQLSENPKQPA